MVNNIFSFKILNLYIFLRKVKFVAHTKLFHIIFNIKITITNDSAKYMKLFIFLAKNPYFQDFKTSLETSLNIKKPFYKLRLLLASLLIGSSFISWFNSNISDFSLKTT